VGHPRKFPVFLKHFIKSLISFNTLAKWHFALKKIELRRAPRIRPGPQFAQGIHQSDGAWV
jgi:hypothetical protein